MFLIDWKSILGFLMLILPLLVFIGITDSKQSAYNKFVGASTAWIFSLLIAIYYYIAFWLMGG